MNDPLIIIIQFLKQIDELQQAKNLLKTFAKHSVSLEQYDKLGMLFQEVKAYNESLEMLKMCSELAITPQQSYAVRANLAKLYNHLNDPENSIINSSINLKINLNDYEALMEQSFSYYLLGDYQKSFEIQDELLTRKDLPENVLKRITFNMGTFHLYKGEFKEGMFKIVHGGKQIGLWPSVKKPFAKWDGEHTDKTILVYGEGGIGDEFTDVRFIKELQNRGYNALWISNHKLTDLFARNNISTIKEQDISMFNDYVYCEAMSLPYQLDMDEDKLWHGPYLSASQEYINKWKIILPENFITIRWNGNPYYDQDLHRGVDLSSLVNVVESYNLPLVSLQVDDNKIMRYNMIDPKIENWEDTLAIQHLAKLNITSCTSTAHSASAIGANTVVLPPIATYYPWIHLKEDNSSWWYGPTTKVFPQTKHKDWTEPLSKLKQYMDTIISC